MITVEFEDIREDEPGYLLGHATILGELHHVEFLRVIQDEDDCQVAWHPKRGPDNENDTRHIRLLESCDTLALKTVCVPGFKGEYVCVVMPYER